jgi:hypothetical protein
MGYIDNKEELSGGFNYPKSLRKGEREHDDNQLLWYATVPLRLTQENYPSRTAGSKDTPKW